MSEFGGLRKHEQTQHALVGLGSAALAVAWILPRYGGPNFPKGIMKCKKKQKKKLAKKPVLKSLTLTRSWSNRWGFASRKQEEQEQEEQEQEQQEQEEQKQEQQEQEEKQEQGQEKEQ